MTRWAALEWGSSAGRPSVGNQSIRVALERAVPIELVAGVDPSGAEREQTPRTGETAWEGSDERLSDRKGTGAARRAAWTAWTACTACKHGSAPVATPSGPAASCGPLELVRPSVTMPSGLQGARLPRALPPSTPDTRPIDATLGAEGRRVLCGGMQDRKAVEAANRPRRLSIVPLLRDHRRVAMPPWLLPPWLVSTCLLST